MDHRRQARGDQGRTAVTVADLAIDSIAAGGDGVARHEGRVVFVPRTAPGDVVRAKLAAKPKARFSRARLLEVLQLSERRIEPPCAHYREDNCGGCQLQHMDYRAQLESKTSIVQDAIARIGKRQVELEPCDPSPLEWRYRRKLTLALRKRGERWIAGLHPYDAPGAVFSLNDCPITSRDVLDVWADIMDSSKWLPDEPSLRGAVSIDEERVSFVLEGGGRWSESKKLFDSVGRLNELWWKPLNGKRRLLHSRAGMAESGTETDPGDTDSGASFLQVNAAVAELIRQHVLGVMHSHTPRTLIDAYAGRGDLAIAASRAGIRTVAIELDRAAVAAARRQIAAPSRAIAGLVEDALEGALPADVVVLNPPRAGVHARVPTQLNTAARRENAPRALIYVSCDPATLARDIARLTAYRISGIRAFDMFPQTAHVETVCELVPEAA